MRNAGEGMEGEEGMVDGTELVAGDDDDVAGQAGDEIADGVAFSQRDQQASRALDQEIILNS